MSRPFRFKQFSITQDHAPMKVGTDGVLLGAWAGTDSPKRILDVGTGTGLIALMLAQRFPEAEIAAIEPNKDAAKDAVANFSNSPFTERLRLVSVQVQSYTPENKFDLIVSNPPYFTSSLLSPEAGRTEARHIVSLNPSELAKASEFLNENGRLSVIYPIETYQTFRTEMKGLGFFELRKLEVKPTPDKLHHRIMGEFGRRKQPCKLNELVIEKYGRHRYSEEYVALTKDFYLFENLNH